MSRDDEKDPCRVIPTSVNCPAKPQLDRIENMLARIDHALHGPYDQPEKGVLSRVKALEDAEKQRQWWIRTVIVASLGSLGLAIKNWIKS